MLRKTWAVFLRELRHILGDRRLLVIMLGFPLLGTTLLNYMYIEHVVKDIPTAIYDQNGTSLSRDVARAFRDCNRFEVTTTVQSEKEMRRAMENKEVQTAVVIPRNYAEDIKKGKGSKIMVAINGTNLLFSNVVQSKAAEITGTISSATEINMLEGEGHLPETAKDMAGPVQMISRVWYNPAFNYPNFLMLGLVATMVQQVLLLYVATAITREKESGTLKELLERDFTPAQVVTGKALPYFLINFLSLNFLLAECYFVFKIPFDGSIPLLLFMEVLFLGAISALGIFISTASKGQLEATQLAMLFALPSFLFCGYTWPLQSMPELARGIAAILPLTYFATNLRDIALMDIQLPVMIKDIIVLGALNIILLPAAVLVFKRQSRKLAD